MSKISWDGPSPAAIYARISRDAEGERLGVERQLTDCRELAAKLGYEVVDEYVDNDISASTRSTKKRPQYDEMMRLARSGRYRAVIAYSNSRLTRRVREYIDLIDLHNAHGVLIRTVVSGDHNLATADGRGAALTVAVWDQAEAERTAERTARAKAQMALDGKFRGGQRPYGFEPDGVTVRESEAQVIREATRAVLEGRTLASIARDLNQRGLQAERVRPVKDAEGKRVLDRDGKPKTNTERVEWTYDRLKEMLIRPRNAGLLAHGLPGRKPDRRRRGRKFELEIVGEAKWPAIVPQDEWRAVVDTLTDPSRRGQNGNEVRWLGSGIYTCGRPTGEVDAGGDPVVCGSTLRPAPSRGQHLYRCVAAAHLTVAADRTDEFVREVVAEKLRDRRVVAAMHPAPDPGLSADREEREKLSRRLDAFERDYAAGDITAAQLRKATESVTARLEDLDRRTATALRRSASSSVLSATDPGAAFLNSPLDVQRAVLASVLSVEVLPQPRRGVKWTSDRLNISLAVKLDETAALAPERVGVVA